MHVVCWQNPYGGVHLLGAYTSSREALAVVDLLKERDNENPERYWLEPVGVDDFDPAAEAQMWDVSYATYYPKIKQTDRRKSLSLYFGMTKEMLDLERHGREWRVLGAVRGTTKDDVSRRLRELCDRLYQQAKRWKSVHVAWTEGEDIVNLDTRPTDAIDDYFVE